eukprot:TRINITY_DN21618_c0_g1_i1.p1 TRINITY_DN21618_c0_g1~~TRINITY_DN21618_c0_g1_i1.p1  ORF type:complete len:185 (-),score=31.01 TRINITY_DN21618_c0_g1_i1:398-952(-)
MAALTSALASLSLSYASCPSISSVGHGITNKSKGVVSQNLGFLASPSLWKLGTCQQKFSQRSAQNLKRLEKQCRPATVTVDAKYKLKTHKASAKRYSATGAGRITRRHAGKQHLLTKKSTTRKNRLAGKVVVARGSLDNIVGACPYLKVKRRLKPKSWRKQWAKPAWLPDAMAPSPVPPVDDAV